MGLGGEILETPAVEFMGHENLALFRR